MAAVRLHHIQEEYAESIRIQWHSFLLWREDAHRGWNGYVAAHWEKAQAAEDSIALTPWSGAVYPSATQPAHIAGKAAARQGLFDAFHLEVMRAFFSLSQNIEDPAVLRRIAETVGCHVADFEADRADPGLKELVWREFMTGVERERVTAIPTMFVGTRVIEGALTLDRYRQVFDTALKENGRMRRTT